MKRITVLLALLCVVVSVVRSQCPWYPNFPCDPDTLNMREYEDRYFMNYCSREGFNFDAFIDGWAGTSFFTETEIDELGGVRPCENCPTNISPDFAQPYIADSAITIAGVSGYIEVRNTNEALSCYHWYFEIWDSSLTTVLRSVDILDAYSALHPLNSTPYYTELFFDEPLTISGKFYVVFHTPDTLVCYDQITGLNGMHEAMLGTNSCSPGADLYPFIRMVGRDWEYIPTTNSVMYNGVLIGDTVTALYLFPILADTSSIDTTNSGIDTTDSYLENVDISNSLYVFPNPTNSEVNINCGYKIKSIQIFDEQGKRLLEKEVNTYNYQLNLDNYPTGTYLIKVQTNSGQATKKVIKE